MSNELQVKESGAMTSAQMNEWGVPVTSKQDVIIPKILPMQGLSAAVAEGRAQMGEFRDSLNNQLLGSIDKPFECIPFFLDKMWDILEEQADGTFKWKKTIPVVEDPAKPEYNDNWQWEDIKDGLKIKNVRRLNFYVLLPDEIEKGSAIPYIFSFKSTSIKEGKKLYTQMYIRNVRAGIPPAAFHVNISGIRQKNQKGVFIVPQYSLAETPVKTTEKELSECLHWIKMIRAGSVRTDESDVQGTADLQDVTPGDDAGTGEY